VTLEELSQISFIANNQVYEFNLKERESKTPLRKSIGSPSANNFKN